MQTDIVVVGGGLAGSLAAAMLGRARRNVVLVDPHTVYPPDFRCEKLEQGHIAVLRRTGLAGPVIRAGTWTDSLWIARYGRIVDKQPFDQYGMAYERLVNTIRAEIPGHVPACHACAVAIRTSPQRQRVELSDGRAIDARLVVLASGLNWNLRRDLGLSRDLVSACHSLTLGFDFVRADGRDFTFPSLQYNPESPDCGVGYLTLFRIGSVMRANLFVYAGLKSPAIAAFRTDPDTALRALLPKLARVIGDYSVKGPVKVRPTDLHAVRDFQQPGFVLVGDAFATPCPATGTGSLKVLTDVERLCNVHIPRWLATPGMGVEKLGAYYEDPIKVASDALSAGKAHQLRALATGRTLNWRLQRGLRFYSRLVKWSLRSALRRSSARPIQVGGTGLPSAVPLRGRPDPDLGAYRESRT